MIFNWYVLWHFFIIVLYLCMIFLFYKFRKNKNLKINLRLNAKDALFALGMLLIIMALLGIAIYSGVLKPNPAKMDITNLVIAIAYFLLFISPVEELLFRGVITHWLVKKTNVFFGLTVSAVIFGAAHLPNGATGINIFYWNWHLAIASGISGLFFGATYLKTRSIINPIMLHAASNIVWILWIGMF